MPNNTYNAVMSLNPDGTGTPYGDTRGGSKYILTVREVSPTEAFHKAGSYIRYNGVAYRCKTDIQANTALVVGTNIEVPDLPDGTVLLTPEESIAMAAGIGYDNRESGLEAEDVQGAIDEVSSKTEWHVMDITKELTSSYSMITSIYYNIIPTDVAIMVGNVPIIIPILVNGEHSGDVTFFSADESNAYSWGVRLWINCNEVGRIVVAGQIYKKGTAVSSLNVTKIATRGGDIR